MKIPRVLLHHPFELCISFCVLLIGIQTFVRGYTMSAIADSILLGVLVITWQAGIVLGGLLILVGIFARMGPLSTPKRILWEGVERSGLYVTMAGTWTYVIVLVTRANGSGYAVAMFISIGLACLLRTLALKQEAERTVETMTKLADGAQ